MLLTATRAPVRPRPSSKVRGARTLFDQALVASICTTDTDTAFFERLVVDVNGRSVAAHRHIDDGPKASLVLRRTHRTPLRPLVQRWVPPFAGSEAPSMSHFGPAPQLLSSANPTEVFVPIVPPLTCPECG